MGRFSRFTFGIEPISVSPWFNSVFHGAFDSALEFLVRS